MVAVAVRHRSYHEGLLACVLLIVEPKDVAVSNHG